MRHITSWQRVNWILLALIWGAAGLDCAPASGEALSIGTGTSTAAAPAATTQTAGMPAFKAAANAPTDSELAPIADATTEAGKTSHTLTAAAPAAPATGGAHDLPLLISATMPATTRPDTTGLAAGGISGAATPVAARVVPAQEKLPLGHLAPAPAEKSESKPGAESSWWVTTATALGIVIGLILILRPLVKRWSGRSGASATSPLVEVLARVAVAPRNHVLLVRLGPRVLVLADSQAGLQLLANIEDGDEVAGLLATVEAGKPNSISRGFGQLMRKMTGDFHRDQELVDEGADVGEFLVDHSREEISGLTARLRTLGQRETRA